MTVNAQPDTYANSPQTAAALMRQDYLLVPEDVTIGDAIDLLRRHRYYRHFYNIYICTSGQKLKGVVDLKDLVSTPADKRVGDLPIEEVISVPPDMDQEEVAEIVSRNNLVELPVVDAEGVIAGAISVDDVVDVLIQEHTEDIFRARGVEHATVAGRSLTGLSIMEHFRARMPWLLISLVGGLIAGAIISGFETRVETLIIALVIYIPFVMALGGNVGSQTATIFVREIALGSVGSAARYFLKEIAVGLLIGGTLGLIVGIIAWIWQGSAVLGWIVGLASLAVSLAGTLIGSFIPWLFDRLGIDTALSSGPIVTTLKDITGLLIYFGIAVLVIRIAGI